MSDSTITTIPTIETINIIVEIIHNKNIKTIAKLFIILVLKLKGCFGTPLKSLYAASLSDTFDIEKTLPFTSIAFSTIHTYTQSNPMSTPKKVWLRYLSIRGLTTQTVLKRLVSYQTWLVE